MNRQKILTLILVIVAVAGTSASVILYREAQESRDLADQARDELEEARSVRAVPSAVREKPVTPVPTPLAGADDLATPGRLELDELEARLAAKDGEIAMLHDRIAELEANSRTNRPPRRPDRGAWLEDLKENDPERYNEIVERRERAREAAKYEVAKKAAFFLDRDTSGMSEEEAEEYEQMMLLLTDTLALTERLGEDLPREERWPIMHEFRDNLRELSPMLDGERDKEFYRIGKDMGYSDTEAESFAAYLTEVVDLTSVQSIFRSSMREMGGWGRGGGPPPGDR